MEKPLEMSTPKKKKTVHHGRQSSARYAAKHNYKPKSNPRRRGGKWVSNRKAQG